jgi:hypothetical protein
MKNNSSLQSLCMYRALCIVYHLDRPMQNIHINTAFFIVSTSTSFDTFASSLWSLLFDKVTISVNL